MRATVLFAVFAPLFWGDFEGPQRASRAAQKDDKKDDKAPAKENKLTPAAEITWTKSLKAKVTVKFTNDARLGDVLKEFAKQVDEGADTQLMWAYGPGFPYEQKVKYSCKDKPLEAALDELFKKVGTPGYLVVSKDGDRHDGWVLLTATGERGGEKGAEPPPKATEAEEAEAADKLALAKALLDAKTADKTEKAKTVLAFIVKHYPGAKAAAEAKELLAKLEK